MPETTKVDAHVRRQVGNLPQPRLCMLILCGTLVALGQRAVAADPETQRPDTTAEASETAGNEEFFLSNVRQLTFAGRRSGEGYFSSDGRKMVFQSEREPGNPFFQIYLLDLETGDIERVSPGSGKTTCAWIHPDGSQVLFASTHDDKNAREKQDEEIELRGTGRERRYKWDYDEHYDVYSWDRQTGSYRNLTSARGYDAEGSWSPDGQSIVFASNRRAYLGELTPKEQKAFEKKSDTAVDIYIMDSNGENVRRLTSTLGYDGGPFFSPDGRRICWRRFSENGLTAEIMTMNVDGSDPRQLTRLGAMSWAPYYHPSGEYLIFNTNFDTKLHGFGNFELCLIDVDATSPPVRVTYTPGFDGLPVFTPNGEGLAWTSRRTASKKSQIFLADWNHQEARRRLGLSGVTSPSAEGSDQAAERARAAAEQASREATEQFSPRDVLRHVDFLCRPELEGRLTGTQGEKEATAYVAAYLDHLGLVPAGDGGTFFQEFEFTSGVALGENSALWKGDHSYEIDTDWRPLAFSQTGNVEPASVVFAGYGITAPEDVGQSQYDSYVHLDVAQKWVLVFRYMPENISPERRQQLARYSSLRHKTMLARDQAARGLIIVSGPNANVQNQLARLRFDGSLSGASIPVISITDRVAQQWLAASGKSLRELQDQLDGGELRGGFALEGVTVSASIDIKQTKQRGRNVLGRLQAASRPAEQIPTEQIIIIGAHVDHLGKGFNASSLARDDEGGIHFGADDNASGVAALLEIAEYLANLKSRGMLKLKRDILFAAWSGEELGLIGSNHFANAWNDQSRRQGAGQGVIKNSLYPAVAACLNLDMVGRLDQKLILQGVGSSSIWRGEVERRNSPVGLPITLQDDSYIPTDASVFFMKGVPILSAFTGSHSDYHTPRDTPEKLNYEGIAKIARFMALVARSLAMRDAPPDYIVQAGPKKGKGRANLRAYLGTIPDYTQADVKGVKLNDVAKNGPAEKAGIKSGDVVVELAGKQIDNIYDYTYAIEALKIGQTVTIAVQRDRRRVSLKITPGSRE